MNEQEWIEKPEALGTLVQQTVRHLIQQRPDKSEQEAQLREVSRTVERLEKMRLSVPEELRRLKTNLVVQTIRIRILGPVNFPVIRTMVWAGEAKIT